MSDTREGLSGLPEESRSSTILIVEDSETNRRLLRRMLQSPDRRILEAADGAEALQILQQQPIDAVISDILMPTMDGYRLCYEVRKEERFQNLPFIFYSSTYYSPADETLAMQLGADCFLTKPASAARITAALDQFTNRVRAVNRAPFALPEELDLMRQYSQRLIEKLEVQNVRLQQQASELQESEARLRDFFDNANDLIAIVNADARLIYFNKSWQTALGYDDAELHGHLLFEFIAPGCVKNTQQAFAQVMQADRRDLLETELLSKDGRSIVVEGSCSVRTTTDGTMNVRVIFRDITARKQAEAALNESQTRLQLLVHASNVGLWDWDLRTNQVFYSIEWKQQIGFEDNEISNRFDEWQSRLHPDDRPRILASVVDFREGRIPSYDVEFRLRRKNDSWRWILCRADIVRDRNGQPLRMMGCHIDITDRKQSEAKLREREQQLSLITDHFPGLVAQVDRDLRYLFVNKMYERWFEVPPSASIGRRMEEVIGTDMFHRAKPFVERALAGEAVTFDNYFETKETRTLYGLTTFVPHRDDVGEIQGFFVVVIDITDRKQAEEELRTSRSFLEKAQQVAHLGTWVSGPDPADSLWWSDETFAIFGIARDQFDGTARSFFQAVHPQDRSIVERTSREAIELNRPYNVEHRIVLPHGNIRWVHELADVVRDSNGRATQMIGVVIDITERKQAEESLRESERFAHATLDALSANIAILDENGIIVGVNRAWRDFARTNSAGISGLCEGANYLHAAESIQGDEGLNARHLAAGIREVTCGARDEFALEYPCHSATEQRWFVAHVTRFSDPGPCRVVVAHENITERKQMEAALRESEASLAAAQERARMGSWEFDVKTGRSRWSHGMFHLFHRDVSLGPPTFAEFLELIHPDDRDHQLEMQHRVILTREPLSKDFRTSPEHGPIRNFNSVVHCVLDQSGEVTLLAGNLLDVTENRQAEAARHASQAMLELILETIPQGVFWKDRHSVYLGANRVTRRAMGLETVGSVAGLTDFDCPALTHAEAEFFVQKDREVMESNQPQFGIEESITRTDGTLMWLDTNKLPMHDSEGNVTGLLGTWQDITERKRSEEELRSSRERLATLSRQLIAAQESERRRVAHELHDEIGQVLTAVSMNLQAIRNTIPSSQSLRIEESLQIVGQAIQQVRDMSLNLRPLMLDDFGLIATIRWFLDRQRERGQFQIWFEPHSSGVPLPTEVSTTCYRVIQEAVTNIQRHANATEIWVMLRESEADVEMCVRDNGVGFDLRKAKQRIAHGASLGLLGMRERVELLGGTCDIHSEPGAGCTIRLRIPVMAEVDSQVE